MPTINGITASINTHDGRLEEFDVDEFPGGVSCFIPAHSGQQFWLNYSVDHPIRAKAISVEFYVDGNRIDTQFPLAVDGYDPPVVGPVKSSITSQYGKNDTGHVYRRDVFFTLLEKEKHKHPRTAGPATSADSAGTIECKVYRAEKTGEWGGTISPEELPAHGLGGSIRGKKGISHTVRLGANIPAAKTVRYTFKNLDPEDAPFAHFRFYYRSKKFLQRSKIGLWSISRPASPVQIFRPLSRGPEGLGLSRKSSLYSSLTKGKAYLAEKLVARHSESTDTIKHIPNSDREDVSNRSSRALSDLDASMRKLEVDIAMAEQQGEAPERLKGRYDKLQKLKETSIVLMMGGQSRKGPKGKEPEYRVLVPEETGSKFKESVLSAVSEDSKRSKG